MRDRGQIGRAFASLFGLVVVLAGIPAGLVILGGGPVGIVPSPHGFLSGLRGPLTDSVLLRAAALLCWILWALFALAVVVELVRHASRFKDRDPGAALRFGVPGVQRVASTLVLTSMLLLPSREVARAPGLPLPPLPEPILATRHLPVEETSAVEPEDRTVRYIVQRYDSPWRIAERHLGDGTRWREITDGCGRSLVAGRRPGARTIFAGEVLLLPADATVSDTPAVARHPLPAVWPAPPGADPPTPSAPMVRPSALVPPAPPVPAIPRTQRPDVPSEGAPAGPGPAGAASIGAVPKSPPRPGLGHDSRQPGTDAGSRPPVVFAVPSNHHGGQSFPSTLAKAGLLSAAILLVVRRLRRHQSRHRPRGRRIRLPEGRVAEVELTLRQAERPDQLVAVENALSALFEDVNRAGHLMPVILGVVASPEFIEVLIDRPVPSPAGWTVSSEGFRWRIEAGSVPARSDLSRSAPLPALVPLGKATAGPAEVLVNLEAARVLGVAGDPARAAGVVRAIATNLAAVPWAQATNVILVGFGAELAALEHVRTTSTIAEAATELRSIAEIMSRVQNDGAVGLASTVVVCAAAPNPEELAVLGEVTGPGSTVVAVIPIADAPARWVIDANCNPMPIDPIRLAIEPTIVSAVDLEDVGQLLDVARDQAGVRFGDPPYGGIELTVGRPDLSPSFPRTPPTSDHDPPAPAVLVRVLGTVELEGAREFRRAKSRELVVYLAMHPSGVGEAELDEALWPSDQGRVVAAATRDSTVSVARTAVGGPDRLLPAQGQGREKRYQLGAGVGSDWATFCALCNQARGSRKVESLHRALELVRGRPFEGAVSGRTYGWVHTEGHGRHIEAEVADTADLAAGLYLERGEPLEARWAARQGLAADPLAERLWVRLMQAADALGESLEIERIMDEMDVVLELGGDFSGLHPNTLSVYDRLSRRREGPSRPQEPG